MLAPFRGHWKIYNLMRISAAKSSQVTFPWHSAANITKDEDPRAPKLQAKKNKSVISLAFVPSQSHLGCAFDTVVLQRIVVLLLSTDHSPPHVSKFRRNSFSFVLHPIFRIESYYPVMSTAHPSPIARQSSAKKQKTDHEQDADGIPIPEVT